MQDRLFFEDVNEALREVVNALGGPKVVGPLLWPEKSVDQAHGQLLACLNSERRERITPEQMLLLLKKGREADCHAAMQFLAREAGYEIKPIRPVDQVAELISKAENLARESRSVAAALDRLTQPGLSVVKS